MSHIPYGYDMGISTLISHILYMISIGHGYRNIENIICFVLGKKMCVILSSCSNFD